MTAKLNIAKALNAAVAAIYFDDSSDYHVALFEVVKNLAPHLVEELEDDPRAVWERTYAAARATPPSPSAAQKTDDHPIPSDSIRFAGKVELPPLPDHPEPMVMQWTELEKVAIRAYGQECARAALASKPEAIDVEEVTSVIEGALVEDMLPFHSK